MNEKNIGPLPCADRPDELQELSITALSRALSPDRFRVRPESKDKGIDLTVELVRLGSFTNLRAQVQMKGTDSETINQDGSRSFGGLPVSNLNYLLNGPSPLYVLYVAPRQELWYAWARDESKRLDKETPDWRTQLTVTLRFRNRLTQDALTEIETRILQEGKLHRDTMEILGRATSGENVVLAIDSATLNVTDPEDRRDLLLRGGLTFVSAGFAKNVLDIADVLNPTDRTLARITLARAYAYFSQGKYDSALGCLADAQMKANDLSKDEFAFLRYLRHSSDYQVGRIPLQDYINSIEALTLTTDSPFALSYRIELLRHKLITTRERSERAPLLAALTSTLAQIESLPDGNEHLKLQSRLVQLFVAADNHVSDYVNAVGRLKMLSSMHRRPTKHQMASAASLLPKWRVWEVDMAGAIQAACGIGRPLLVADALLTRSTMRVDLLSMQRLIALWMGVQFELDAETARGTLQDLDQAMQVYATADALESRVRAALLRADLFELQGRRDEARKIAGEVLPIAEALSLRRIEAHAREHLAGTSLLEQTAAQFQSAQKEDDDVLWSTASDDDLRRMARDTLEALGLPEGRLPVLEQDLMACRQMASDRLDWCRFIELQQDKTHTLHDQTLYASPPNWKGHCQKLDYWSALEHPDWKAVMHAFKNSRCAQCLDRTPKKSVRAF